MKARIIDWCCEKGLAAVDLAAYWLDWFDCAAYVWYRKASEKIKFHLWWRGLL